MTATATTKHILGSTKTVALREDIPNDPNLPRAGVPMKMVQVGQHTVTVDCGGNHYALHKGSVFNSDHLLH